MGALAGEVTPADAGSANTEAERESATIRIPGCYAPGAIPEVCRDAVVYAGMDDAADWAAAILALRSEPLRSANAMSTAGFRGLTLPLR